MTVENYHTLRHIQRRGFPFEPVRDAHQVYEYSTVDGQFTRYKYLRRDVFGFRPIMPWELLCR